MFNYYEVNVSLAGMHYFATAPRSITDEFKAHQVASDFTKRFPEAEGFKVTCTKWESSGRNIQL